MSIEMNPGEPWGKCFVSGCPLPGSMGRGSEWACFCHVNADARDFGEITHMLKREHAIGESACDIRSHLGGDHWPSAYRAIQRRLVEADRRDLLFNADAKDEPTKGAQPVIRMWLGRLESELSRMADEIMRSNSGSPIRVPLTVRTATIIGPTHALTHYSEVE